MKKTKKRYKRSELENTIINFYRQHPKKAYNYKQLANALKIHNSSQKEMLQILLEKLCKEKILEELHKGKYKLHSLEIAKLREHPNYVIGKIEISATGRAYVKSDDFEEEIKIDPGKINQALNGDIVKVFLYAKRPGKKPEGEVVEIISREKTEFVGIIEATDKFAFLIPDNNEAGTDIFIPPKFLNGAKNGQKAIVKILEWPKHSKSPIGEVIRVIGNPGENETEICSILINHNLPLTFPDDVIAEAQKIEKKINESEINKRIDYRDVLTFTIDPIDAKDFDDAISYKKLENNKYEIGIHIADVSHYVKPGSKIDKEAIKRGTSVYLVDRVIPMLPERLSNDLCSLNPGEDKLCFSAIFILDENAKVLEEKFAKTIIRSDRRFTYEEAQERIETGQGDLADILIELDKLAKKLRTERFKNGSISFDKSEIKFKLDAKGSPIDVYVKEIKDSNHLIEEFMLLANRKVAELISTKAKNLQMVYRVHDSPETEKLTEFAKFVSKLGYKFKIDSPKQIVNSFNNLLEKIKGKPEQNLIETLAIRTMAKAHYTTKNIGHYGLAFKYYTHFTSPIRRYPDILVHRILYSFLNNKNHQPNNLEELCKQASKMEIIAQEAERESIKFKQTEYLSKFIDCEFDGFITGITKWGIYVELIENKCEGMIRLKDLNDDFYYFDEENYRIIGSRYKNVFQIGDKVRVIVLNTDILKRHIDFGFVKKL